MEQPKRLIKYSASGLASLGMIKRWSAIIALLFLTQIGVAQEIYFENYSTKNGLSSNEVYDIYQDGNGLLWFATDRGICHFNGYEFKKLGITEGLTSTTVFRFHPQPDGNFWCTTVNNRLFYLNHIDYTIHEYQFNDLLEKQSKGRISNDLFIDHDGSLNMSFSDKTGVVRIDSEGVLIDQISGGSKMSIFNDSSLIVLESMNDGRTFFYSADAAVKPRSTVHHITKRMVRGSDRGYYRAAKKGNTELISGSRNVYLYRDKQLTRTIPFEHEPISIGFYDDDHFWVGLRSEGAKIYDLHGNFVSSVILNESVTDILTDHENGIWISTTNSGVYYSSNTQIRNYPLIPKSSDISLNRNGQLTAHTSDGRIFTKTHLNWQLKLPKIDQRPVLSQYYESLDLTLINQNEELRIEEDNVLIKQSSYIPKFSEEAIPTPWFVGFFNFHSYDTIVGLKTYNVGERVNDVCPRADGKSVYLACKSGLYYFDIESKKRKKISDPKTNIHISDIDRIEDDIYLIATRGNGLLILKNNKVLSITERDGLCSDLISEVFVQDSSTIWVCTNTGLNRIRFEGKNNFEVISISRKDGLIDNDVRDIEILDDTIWVLTGSGLCSFPISLVGKKSLNDNHFLKIIDFRVNGKRVLSLTNLDHTQNKIEINFQAISFKKSANLEYRYKLIELETTWNYTNNLQVVYEDMQPGDYTFILQVKSDNGWSSPISQGISISPPFHQTLWFKLSIGLLIILLIYLFFKYQILSYNKDISREILRQLLKRLKGKPSSFVIRVNGKDVKIRSIDVLFVKSSDNYIEVHTINGKFLTREKISNFLKIVPDPIEYLRIQRSYIIRIDKVTAKSKHSITINSIELKIGNTYLEVLSQIHL